MTSRHQLSEQALSANDLLRISELFLAALQNDDQNRSIGPKLPHDIIERVASFLSEDLRTERMLCCSNTTLLRKLWAGQSGGVLRKEFQSNIAARALDIQEHLVEHVQVCAFKGIISVLSC